jgi:hypothetical protein
MRIEVRRGGLLTTIQDLGRPGHAALGVGRGGVADAYSARVANLLVGNRVDAALLEVTLAGPALHFPAAARIALCGADIEATANDEALPGWRPVELAPGACCPWDAAGEAPEPTWPSPAAWSCPACWAAPRPTCAADWAAWPDVPFGRVTCWKAARPPAA